MTEQPKMESKTEGSGQSVNTHIVIGEGGIKWVVIGFLALLLVLIFTTSTALKAEIKANNAIKASEDKQTEYRLIQLWLQEASATCTAAGVNTPAIPAAILK